MGKQIDNGTKKIIGILLSVFFIISMTLATVNAFITSVDCVF